MKTKLGRYVIIAFIVLFAGLLGWGSINYIRHHGQTKIKLIAVPHDASVTIDGVPSKEGIIYLKQGSHTLTAKRQYFEDTSKTVNTQDLKNGQIIYLLPPAVSAEALSYLKAHPDIQREREAGGGAEDQEIQSQVTKKYPFISQLPYSNSHFRVDYALGPNNKDISLTITIYAIINGPRDYPRYQQQLQQFKGEALEYLRSINIDPSSYKITYTPTL